MAQQVEQGTWDWNWESDPEGRTFVVGSKGETGETREEEEGQEREERRGKGWKGKGRDLGD